MRIWRKKMIGKGKRIILRMVERFLLFYEEHAQVYILLWFFCGFCDPISSLWGKKLLLIQSPKAFWDTMRLPLPMRLCTSPMTHKKSDHKSQYHWSRVSSKVGPDTEPEPLHAKQKLPPKELIFAETLCYKVKTILQNKMNKARILEPSLKKQLWSFLCHESNMFIWEHCFRQLFPPNTDPLFPGKS